MTQSSSDPLTGAAQSGDVTFLRDNPKACTVEAFLSAASKDIEHHRSPLYWAARYGQVEFIQHLLSLSILFVPQLFLVCDNSGHSPLHIACEFGSILVAQCLYSAWPSSLMALSHDGTCPLLTAYLNEQSHVVQHFVNTIDSAHSSSESNNERMKSAGELMYTACERGDVAGLAHLIEENGSSEPIESFAHRHMAMHMQAYDIQARGGCLYVACKNNHLKVAAYLVSHRGSCLLYSGAGHYGYLPLHAACITGSLPLAMFLVQVGGDRSLDALASDNWTPLMLACRYGHLPLVAYIVENHGTPQRLSATTCDGWTLVYISAYYGQPDVLRLLVSHMGVNALEITTTSGSTPLFAACMGCHLDAVKVITAMCPRTVFARHPVTLKTVEETADEYDRVAIAYHLSSNYPSNDETVEMEWQRQFGKKYVIAVCLTAHHALIL